MALSMRSVKLKINATKKTAQITKAMNMISASKLKTSEKSIREFQPFITKIQEIIANIMVDKISLQDVNNVLLKPRPIKKICFIAISSDKGLSGAFNINVLKELTQKIKEVSPDISYTVLPLGLKAYYYCKRKNYPIYLDKITNVRDDVEFEEMMSVIRDVVKGFMQEDFDEVDVIYNHYHNNLIQEVQTTKLLPIVEFGKPTVVKNYEFDGNIEEMLKTILPIYVENLMYGFVLDSKASEHASRMNAMKKATDNASEIVDKLTLLYNRARQQAITLELTDSIGGATIINEK